jgi:hypothetical protein
MGGESRGIVGNAGHENGLCATSGQRLLAALGVVNRASMPTMRG